MFLPEKSTPMFCSLERMPKATLGPPFLAVERTNEMWTPQDKTLRVLRQEIRSQCFTQRDFNNDSLVDQKLEQPRFRDMSNLYLPDEGALCQDRKFSGHRDHFCSNPSTKPLNNLIDVSCKSVYDDEEKESWTERFRQNCLQDFESKSPRLAYEDGCQTIDIQHQYTTKLMRENYCQTSEKLMIFQHDNNLALCFDKSCQTLDDLFHSNKKDAFIGQFDASCQTSEQENKNMKIDNSSQTSTELFVYAQIKPRLTYCDSDCQTLSEPLLCQQDGNFLPPRRDMGCQFDQPMTSSQDNKSRSCQTLGAYRPLYHSQDNYGNFRAEGESVVLDLQDAATSDDSNCDEEPYVCPDAFMPRRGFQADSVSYPSSIPTTLRPSVRTKESPSSSTNFLSTGEDDDGQSGSDEGSLVEEIPLNDPGWFDTISSRI